MNGNCDSCGINAELDCLYNEDTGEELFLCEACVDEFKEDSLEDIERTENKILDQQEYSAYKRGIGGY